MKINSIWVKTKSEMSKWRRDGSCEVNCLLPGRMELRPAITALGRERLRQWSLTTGGLSLIVVLLSFWENSEYHSNRDHGAPIITALRFLMIALTGFQLLLIICTNHIAKRLKSRWFILDCLIVIPMSLPYYDCEIRMSQLGKEMIVSLDDIFVPFTCLRLYHFAKSLQYFSFFSSARTDFQVDLHKVPSQSTFLIKAILHHRSVSVLIAVIATNVITTGLLLRVFERTVTSHSEQLEYIWNGLWLSLVSDNTIGYGDIVPMTHIGRALISVSILLGIILIAYSVGWIYKVTSLDVKELRLSASIMVKRFASRELFQAAVTLIQTAWKLHKKRQKGENRIVEVLRFSLSIHKFKFQHNLCKAKSEPTFRDQLYFFERAVRPRILSTTEFLPIAHHSDTLVTAT